MAMRREALARHRVTDGGLSGDYVRMFRSEVVVLEKFSRACTSDRLRGIAERRISQVQAELALVMAKARLRERNYSEATRNLATAVTHLRNGRNYLRLAKIVLGLTLCCVAPGLLRWIVKRAALSRIERLKVTQPKGGGSVSPSSSRRF